MIEFLDPRPPSAVTIDTFVARPVDRHGAPRVIGMLANGFPDSEAFLRHLAAAMHEGGPPTEFRFVTKARPPDALTDEQLALLTTCDSVVAAYGH